MRPGLAVVPTGPVANVALSQGACRGSCVGLARRADEGLVDAQTRGGADQDLARTVKVAPRTNGLSCWVLPLAL